MRYKTTQTCRYENEKRHGFCRVRVLRERRRCAAFVVKALCRRRGSPLQQSYSPCCCCHFFFFACEKLPFLRLIRKTLVLREIFVRCVQTKQQHTCARGAHTYLYIYLYTHTQYTRIVLSLSFFQSLYVQLLRRFNTTTNTTTTTTSQHFSCSSVKSIRTESATTATASRGVATSTKTFVSRTIITSTSSSSMAPSSRLTRTRSAQLASDVLAAGN